MAYNNTSSFLSLLPLNRGPDADGLISAIMDKASVYFSPNACDILRGYCMYKPSDDRPELALLLDLNTEVLARSMLELLVVRLCPNLGTLRLESDFACILPWFEKHVPSKQMLPALRTIRLISDSQSFPSLSVGQRLSLAPNLETLYVTNKSARAWTVRWKCTFLQLCPQPRDLQYTHSSSSFHQPVDWRDVVAALAPVHKTLRQLAVRLLNPQPAVTGSGTSTASLETSRPWKSSPSTKTPSIAGQRLASLFRAGWLRSCRGRLCGCTSRTQNGGLTRTR